MNISKKTESKNFQRFLKSGDLVGLKAVKKTDFHQHATNSATIELLRKEGVILPESNINTIEDMRRYLNENMSEVLTDPSLLLTFLNCNLKNCIDDGIKFVSSSIDYKIGLKAFNGDEHDFVGFLRRFQNQKKEINFRFDIGISRVTFCEAHKEFIIRLIDTGFFEGLDLYSVENYAPNSKFVDIFNYAKNKGLINKAHIGEFSDSDCVVRTIKELGLNEVQHGISIVNNRKDLKYARKSGVVFHVCPTSNVKLERVKNIKEHPIKKMYKNRLKLTIGSDDLLFFNSTVSEEYLKLYNEKTLSAKALDKIRKFALSLRTK